MPPPSRGEYDRRIALANPHTRAPAARALVAGIALVLSGCGGRPGAASPAPDAAGGITAIDGGFTSGGRDAGGSGADARPGAGADSGAPTDSGNVSIANPCPAAPTPCRILPMGDSITFGMRATPTGHNSIGGYRRYLARSLLAAGKHFEYVGSCPGFVGRCPVPGGDPPICFPGGDPDIGQHDGHPGWDINAFRARQSEQCPGSIQSFLSRVVDGQGDHVTPNIILLMVGANDVRAGSGIRAGAATRFGYLLTDLHAAVPPATRVVVGLVTPNLNGTNNQDGVIPFDQKITKIVRARRDQGWNVRLVNTYSAIEITAAGTSPDLSSDLLHPNEQGYQNIAAVWYKAIAPWVH